MTDGCWVQFWDDKNCAGATLRFDTEGSARTVANLDDFEQSDGSKEGNEPDSLETGSRAWLIVYKDNDFKGTQARFGPSTQVSDLSAYGVGGSISSFKLFDSEPAGFVPSTLGGPTVPVNDGGPISSETVNTLFRTSVTAALALIPYVGGALGALVRGLWPQGPSRDQVWGCFQNYLNQAIAGVYWQITYSYLNDSLTAMFNAAEAYITTLDTEVEKKREDFFDLYYLVRDADPYFVDETAPEKKAYFLVPYATLRLATMREQLEHYEFYYGSPPSPAERERMTTDIQDAIARYTALLADARKRILERRDAMIAVDGNVMIDHYDGKRMLLSEPKTLDSRRHYSQNVLNKLALRLDEYIAVSQLWPHFDPAVTAPVTPPVIDYVTGPTGYFWYGVPDFEQVAQAGQRVTAVKLWTIDGGNNPAFQNGLELFIDGAGQGRVGGTGGDPAQLDLAAGETVVEVSGRSSLRYLRFVADDGDTVSAGDPQNGSDFSFEPAPGVVNSRMTGVSGSAGLAPGEPASVAAVRAIAVHWTGELPIEAPGAPEVAAKREHAEIER